jgi:hypothetical protein
MKVEVLSGKAFKFLYDILRPDQIHDAGYFDTRSPAQLLRLLFAEFAGCFGKPVNA